jgi:NodT family efflux transporter outer membrane factor (OMF) lipoprotein
MGRLGPRGLTVIALVGALALSTSCTVGPDYVKPSARVPAAYKEVDGWKVARPQDDASRGPWWGIFGNPELSALEERVNLSNQDVAAAEARFRQARALVEAARASYFPTVAIGAAVTRTRPSSNVSSPSSASGTTTEFTLPVDVSWELDVRGRIRRTVEANRAGAQASAADLEALRLSVQAELAQDYFQLRALDAQKQLVEATAADYEKSLELTQNRYASGVAARAEVLQAETQLKTTQAQAIDVGVQRAQIEHAIALLVGEPASVFALPQATLATEPPDIPVGVPSELLERRPDIAGAERRMAAANAQIGVAEAAFFPSVTLSASAGLGASSLAKWFLWPSRFWAIGAAVAESVFDAGLRRAETDQARAVYDTTVAAYRQTVLAAFQAVEDNLAALRILEEEGRVQDEAVRAARQSVTLTTNRYQAGVVGYLDVVVAQTIALSNERTAVDILGRRMTASVLLVKALGGGWHAAALPSASTQVEPASAPEHAGG